MASWVAKKMQKISAWLCVLALVAVVPGVWADHHEVVVINEPVIGTDPVEADEENPPTILFADHYDNLFTPRIERGVLRPAQLDHGELFSVIVQYEKDPALAEVPVVLRWGNSMTQVIAQKTEEPTVYRAGLYQVEPPSGAGARQVGVTTVLNAAKGAMITAEAQGFAADLLVADAKPRIVVRPAEEWSNRASLTSLNTDQPFKVEVHVPRAMAQRLGETLVVKFKTKQAGSTGSLRVSAAGAGSRGPVVYTHRSTLTLTNGGEGEGRTPTEEAIWGVLPDSLLTPFTDYDLYKMSAEKTDALVVSYENARVEMPVYWSWRQQRLAQLIEAFDGLRQLYAAGLVNSEVTREAKLKLNRKLTLIKNLDIILAVPSEQLDDIRRLVIVEAYFRMVQDDPDVWDMESFGPLNYGGTRHPRFGFILTSRAEGYTLAQATEAGRQEYGDRFVGFARDLTVGGYQLITQVTGTNQALMIFTKRDAMGRYVSINERILAGIDLISQAAMMGAVSLKAAKTAREGAGGLERARLAGAVKATEGTDAARASLNRVLDPSGTRRLPRRIASSNETLPSEHPRYVPPEPPAPKPGARPDASPMREVGTPVATPNGVAPVRLQESCSTCGEATAGTTIERLTGRQVPEPELVRWSDDAGRAEPGTWPGEMEALLNAHGVDTRVPFGRRFPEASIVATGDANVPHRIGEPGVRTVPPDPKLDTTRFTTADASREIRDGNQVLTVVSYARGRGQTDPTPHWVIIEGVGDGKITRGGATVIDGPYVIVGDPGTGRSVAIAQDDFVRHWSRESTIVAVNPRHAGSLPLPTRPVGTDTTPISTTRPSIAPRGGNVVLTHIDPVLRAVAGGRVDAKLLGRVAREMDKAHFELVHGGSRRRFEAATDAIYEELKRARMSPAMRELIGQRFAAAKANGETFFGGRIQDAVERELGIARTTSAMRNEVRGQGYIDPHTNREMRATADMEADHIYPVSKIMDLPGFKDLNWQQRMAVIHWRKNIQPLPRELNNFKRDYLADEWNAKLIESGKGPLDRGYLNKVRQQQSELAEALARRIACLRTGGQAASCLR